MPSLIIDTTLDLAGNALQQVATGVSPTDGVNLAQVEALILAAAPTTRWVPLTNGDPDDPQIIFDGLGQVVVVEEPI